MTAQQIDASGRLRHLLTLEGLPRETLLQLLDRAGQIRDAAVGRVGNKRHVLAGSAVCTLFFEPSTRTRSSFQLAAQRGRCAELRCLDLVHAQGRNRLRHAAQPGSDGRARLRGATPR